MARQVSRTTAEQKEKKKEKKRKKWKRRRGRRRRRKRRWNREIKQNGNAPRGAALYRRSRAGEQLIRE